MRFWHSCLQRFRERAALQEDNNEEGEGQEAGCDMGMDGRWLLQGLAVFAVFRVSGFGGEGMVVEASGVGRLEERQEGLNTGWDDYRGAMRGTRAAEGFNSVLGFQG